MCPCFVLCVLSFSLLRESFKSAERNDRKSRWDKTSGRDSFKCPIVNIPICVGGRLWEAMRRISFGEFEFECESVYSFVSRKLSISTGSI